MFNFMFCEYCLRFGMVCFFEFDLYFFLVWISSPGPSRVAGVPTGFLQKVAGMPTGFLQQMLLIQILEINNPIDF